jgi:23S rRNA pseudouridine955/2504/2580 synthase/23S rRNA pseudouridine1911/1915/1917 synthase
VPHEAAGSTLAGFLAARFPYHDRAGWCERIASGHVTVNDDTCLPETVLKTGDRLAYDSADGPEPPVDFTIGIVSDDDDLLIVNKSGDLPCHPGGRYFNHTLWAWLKKERGLTDFTFVNRIDRETSGLVVIAKNEAASNNCRKQFAGRKVIKRYQALVEATDFPAEITATGWMTADTGSAIRKKRKFIAGAACPGTLDAESAETKFRLIKSCGDIALIEAEPHTGRLHQIRATLLALGFPMVGDKLYGVDETIFLRFCKGELTEEDRVRLRMDRQALHASGLSFRHPKFGRPVTLDLDLPDDMRQLLKSESDA